MVNSNKNDFGHLAQTSDNPLGFEVEYAEGIYFYDKGGRPYFDLISGISVNSLGHRHPEIIKAIKSQCDKYLHVMAYGEFVEEPQKEYAAFLVKHLPETLNSVYFVNSGSEAIEGALKLAKRYTSRTEIISFENSYYGGTHGSLSIAGNLEFKNAFRPLLPDVRMIRYNDETELKHITERTACVVAECIQGESGATVPDKDYMMLIRKRCTDVGAMLIIDEVQTGFGRTGDLFAFEYSKTAPDILVLAKALGGGMPLGAFIADEEVMGKLKKEPVLGHITTFGGHPVCCAAGMAFANELLKTGVYKLALEKEKIFRDNLRHELIKEIKGRGLLLAARFENEDICQRVINKCYENGIITDSFVFAGDCLRISPALIISNEEIKEVSLKIISCINKL